MKKTMIAGIALAIATSVSGLAHAEKPGHHDKGERRDFRIEKLDTNGDGAISKKEFMAGAQERAAKMFERMDRNGDGVLTSADKPKDRDHKGGPRGHDNEGRHDASPRHSN